MSQLPTRPQPTGHPLLFPPPRSLRWPSPPRSPSTSCSPSLVVLYAHVPEAGRRLHRTHSSPRVAIVPPRRIRPSPSPPRRTLSIPLLLARSLPSSVARTPSPCRHRARGHKPPRRSGGSRGAPPSSSAPYASARSSRSASRRRHRPSSPTTAAVVVVDLRHRDLPGLPDHAIALTVRPSLESPYFSASIRRCSRRLELVIADPKLCVRTRVCVLLLPLLLPACYCCSLCRRCPC